MLHFARWKQAVILGVCLLGVLLCLPNLMPRSAFPSWMAPRQISLGLDLRGGSYLLLEVDLNTVVRERLESAVDGVRGKLRTANIRYVNLAADGPNRRMGFRVLDPAQVSAHPLRIGLSMEVTVDVKSQDGKSLAEGAQSASSVQTAVYELLDGQATAEIQRVIANNMGAGKAAPVPAGKS